MMLHRKVNAVAKKLSAKRIKEIRDRFQHERPTPEQLIASREAPVSQAAFLATWQAVDALKKARRDANLSLSQVAARGVWTRLRSAAWRPASTSTPPSTPSAVTPLPSAGAWFYHFHCWSGLRLTGPPRGRRRPPPRDDAACQARAKEEIVYAPGHFEEHLHSERQ
jgi:hypothetical protein